MDQNKKFKFSIDRGLLFFKENCLKTLINNYEKNKGGTFTDVYCITPDGKIVTEKILSENPQFYLDAPTYAIKKILSQVVESNFYLFKSLIQIQN